MKKFWDEEVLPLIPDMQDMAEILDYVFSEKWPKNNEQKIAGLFAVLWLCYSGLIVIRGLTIKQCPPNIDWTAFEQLEFKISTAKLEQYIQADICPVFFEKLKSLTWYRQKQVLGKINCNSKVYDQLFLTLASCDKSSFVSTVYDNDLSIREASILASWLVFISSVETEMFSTNNVSNIFEESSQPIGRYDNAISPIFEEPEEIRDSEGNLLQDLGFDIKFIGSMIAMLGPWLEVMVTQIPSLLTRNKINNTIKPFRHLFVEVLEKGLLEEYDIQNYADEVFEDMQVQLLREYKKQNQQQYYDSTSISELSCEHSVQNVKIQSISDKEFSLPDDFFENVAYVRNDGNNYRSIHRKRLEKNPNLLVASIVQRFASHGYINNDNDTKYRMVLALTGRCPFVYLEFKKIQLLKEEANDGISYLVKALCSKPGYNDLPKLFVPYGENYKFRSLDGNHAKEVRGWLNNVYHIIF